MWDVHVILTDSEYYSIRGRFNNTKIMEINKNKNDSLFIKNYKINRHIRKDIGKKKGKLMYLKNYFKNENNIKKNNENKNF